MKLILKNPKISIAYDWCTAVFLLIRSDKKFRGETDSEISYLWNNRLDLKVFSECFWTRFSSHEFSELLLQEAFSNPHNFHCKEVKRLYFSATSSFKLLKFLEFSKIFDFFLVGFLYRCHAVHVQNILKTRIEIFYV